MSDPDYVEIATQIITESIEETDEGNVIRDDDAVEFTENIHKILAFEHILREEGELAEESVFEQIDGFQSDEWFLESLVLTRLQNMILDELEKADEKDPIGEELPIDVSRAFARVQVSDEVILFFTMANEMVRGVSGELIDERIHSKNRRNSSSLGFAKDLDQYDQENLLFYAGIIDSGLKGEIANVRKTRNKLTHELRERHFLREINNLESRIHRTLEAINSLFEIKEGEKRFI